jgi:diacylglycerol kinase (ATP)
MTNEKPQDANALKGKTGLRRLLNAFGYSLQGFRAAWQNEAAFREEAMLTIVLTPVALFLPVTGLEKLLLILSLLLLVLVELLNSAVEAVVDRIGPEIHPLSGRAKDLGSAAVLIACLILGLTWLFIAVPAVLGLFL